MTAGRVVVVGIGCEDRRDDGVGVLVAAQVAEMAPAVVAIGPVAEPLDLLGQWDGADVAVVIDAVGPGSTAGSVWCVELEAEGELDHDTREVSDARLTTTHGVGLRDVRRLAHVLGTGPKRVVVVGVEGADFGWGATLSPAVAAAVPAAVRRVIELVAEAAVQDDGVSSPDARRSAAIRGARRSRTEAPR